MDPKISNKASLRNSGTTTTLNGNSPQNNSSVATLIATSGTATASPSPMPSLPSPSPSPSPIRSTNVVAQRPRRDSARTSESSSSAKSIGRFRHNDLQDSDNEGIGYQDYLDDSAYDPHASEETGLPYPPSNNNNHQNQNLNINNNNNSNTNNKSNQIYNNNTLPQTPGIITITPVPLPPKFMPPGTNNAGVTPQPTGSAIHSGAGNSNNNGTNFVPNLNSNHPKRITKPTNQEIMKQFKNIVSNDNTSKVRSYSMNRDVCDFITDHISLNSNFQLIRGHSCITGSVLVDVNKSDSSNNSRRVFLLLTNSLTESSLNDQTIPKYRNSLKSIKQCLSNSFKLFKDSKPEILVKPRLAGGNWSKPVYPSKINGAEAIAKSLISNLTTGIQKCFGKHQGDAERIAHGLLDFVMAIDQGAFAKFNPFDHGINDDLLDYYAPPMSGSYLSGYTDGNPQHILPLKNGEIFHSKKLSRTEKPKSPDSNDYEYRANTFHTIKFTFQPSTQRITIDLSFATPCKKMVNQGIVYDIPLADEQTPVVTTNLSITLDVPKSETGLFEMNAVSLENFFDMYI